MTTGLSEKIERKTAKIGIIGLGYVGLPLILRFCDEGFAVTGFDTDRTKVEKLNKGQSYIRHIRPERISACRDRGTFDAASDMQRLCEMDVLIICVPTPLNRQREPELKYVRNTAITIAENMRKGQLISLESTTYPGTTEEVLLPLFTKTGFMAGKDFFLIFSPEREDPGRVDFGTENIPKIVGGITEECTRLGVLLYSKVVREVIPLSSPAAAEMTKLLENIYRSVNIAMVNELKMLCDVMRLDVWEVIEAARTKPFGFQAFYPGPGLGGHCIPIDPFYLTWKARQYNFSTKFIELAGEINTEMPAYVVSKVVDALNDSSKCIKGSSILILGVAYKKDVDDMRESPAIHIIELLQKKGASVQYNDPHVPKVSGLRGHDISMKSLELSERTLSSFDCVLIVTDHSAYDYDWIARTSSLVVDTRNAAPDAYGNVVKA